MFKASTRFGAIWDRNLPELFAEAQMRPDDRQCFGVEVRHVHRVADRSFEQRGADRLRDLDADAFLRFGGGGAEMRSENKIGRAAQWRIGGQRFRFENIERRAGHMSILQRLGQGGFVDQAAARAIDDADAALCFLQTRSIDKVMRFRGQRRVQRNEIGAREQIVEFFDELDLQTARARGGEIWIVSDHAHAEGDGAPAQLAADPSHADHAERFVVELDAFETFSVPFSGANARFGRRNFSRDAEQKRKRVLGRRDGISAGRIQDDDAAARGRFNIDIVHADAGATDHAQFAPGVQDIRGHFGLAAHDERAELRNNLEQVAIRSSLFAPKHRGRRRAQVRPRRAGKWNRR